jgi:hypothetical protein
MRLGGKRVYLHSTGYVEASCLKTQRQSATTSKKIKDPRCLAIAQFADS